jgi:hypothetical protein
MSSTDGVNTPSVRLIARAALLTENLLTIIPEKLRKCWKEL